VNISPTLKELDEDWTLYCVKDLSHNSKRETRHPNDVWNNLTNTAGMKEKYQNV